MSEAMARRALARDRAAFYGGLSVLAVAILAAKFSLWQANALQSDWAFYNNIFLEHEFPLDAGLATTADLD